MRSRGSVAAGVCALALALPGAASGAAGDVFVVDEEFNTDGAVLKIAPSGGAPATFAADPVLWDDPWGMVSLRDRKGSLLVADYTKSIIFRVAPTGAIYSWFSDPANQSGITDLAWGPDGNLYVIDYTTLNIFRLNPVTKKHTEVADNTGVPDWNNAYDITVARDLTIYFTSGGNEVFQVTPGGPVTKLYEGPALNQADGLVLSPDERYLYVGDFGANSIVRIDLRNPSAPTTFGSGHADVTGLAQLRDGGFLAGNASPTPSIERVPFTGSPTTQFSQDMDYDYPHDIVVEPPLCGGKLPTVVGVDQRDVLRGSRFADVILTLGKNDTVRGLGGNDVICGDLGGDRLFGGKGRDTLLGGKGRDHLFGGKGRDRLRGGPGQDTQAQ